MSVVKLVGISSETWDEWNAGGSQMAVLVEAVRPLVAAGKPPAEIRKALAKGQPSETDVVIAWLIVKLGAA